MVNHSVTRLAGGVFEMLSADKAHVTRVTAGHRVSVKWFRSTELTWQCWFKVKVSTGDFFVQTSMRVHQVAGAKVHNFGKLDLSVAEVYAYINDDELTYANRVDLRAEVRDLGLVVGADALAHVGSLLPEHGRRLVLPDDRRQAINTALGHAVGLILDVLERLP